MIGKSLREAREARGWTRSDVAREIGVADSTYDSYEGGAKVPANRVLKRIVEKMPELAERIAAVRKQYRPRNAAFTRRSVGAQTTRQSIREHAIGIAAARQRSKQ